MNLPKLAVLRPITTAMALISVLVFGGIAMSRLPLAYLPEIDVPYIGVVVPYPNSNPAQVEKEVTKPLEEILGTIPGIKKMHSTSEADEAQVELEFNWGEDLDIVRMQVSEKVDQIKADLPDRVGEIAIWSFNTNDIPVVQGRISAEGVDLSESYALIEARILNRLRRVPGVARVTIDGVEPREIFIDLVLDKIKEHDVEVGELIQTLSSSSTNVVLGQVDAGGLRYTARALGQFRSVEEIGGLLIDPRGLRLSDVAELYYEEPPIGHGRHLNGQKAIGVEVFKESTANTVDVVHAVAAVIDGEIDSDPLLKGIDFWVWEDQAEQITLAANGLLRAGLIGALLAIGVLYLFLRRFGATLIVSLSIPFSIIAACGVLYFLGKSLNLLSMMGLMLGVGMLVDNAIVVLESIERSGRGEPDRKRAAIRGAKAVWIAVAASTTTTLIVFLPLVLGGSTDLEVWLGEIGFTICLALICSLFSSLTLIPLVSARFLKSGTVARNRPIEWLEKRYVGLLGWTLKHRLLTLVAVLLVVAGGIVVPMQSGLIKTGMFSAQVNKHLFMWFDFSDFVYKSGAEAMVEEVEAYIDANREEFLVESIYSYFESNRAQVTLTLTQQNLDDEEIKELRGKIREGLPEIAGAKVRFREDEDSGGGSTYFAVNFFGQDTDVLAGYAEEAQRRLETIEGINDVSSTLRRGRKEIQVTVDRDKAASLGLTPEEVSQALSFTLGAVRLPRFNAGEREVETSLALRLEDRQNLADLKLIPFRNIGGRPVALGDVARFQVVEKPQEIRRQDRKARVAVRATYEGEDWDGARSDIEGLMNAFWFPGGYSWSWNDRILEQDSQNAKMGVNMLIALALVFLVMAALFESLAQPFAILFSILFAIPGALWMLILTGTPMNLMAMIGLLILMGIVVNNGIVLLDHMNQLRASGMARDEAILQAGRDRMRPILMTASTTIIGLTPLAFGGSRAGGLFYYPLALTVMGGLISSAILTLLILPYITLGVEGVAAWARRVWHRSGSAKAQQDPVEPAAEPSPAAG